MSVRVDAALAAWFLIGLSLCALAQVDDSPASRIEQKAANVRVGDQESISALVNEIFRSKGWDSEFSTDAGRIKQKLIAAEVRFHTQRQPGVSEGNIVRAVNTLVRTLDLPEYARTDAYEVRKLRITLMSGFPHVIGPYAAGRDAASNAPPLPEKLGPVEAVFIASTLVQNKILLGEYQMTAQERRSQWSELHQPTSGKKPQISGLTERGVELKRRYAAGISRLSAADRQQLLDNSLSAIGIE